MAPRFTNEGNLFQSNYVNAKSFAAKTIYQLQVKESPVLERIFELWKKGELEDLFLEGEIIQALLIGLRKPSSIAGISKKYL